MDTEKIEEQKKDETVLTNISYDEFKKVEIRVGEIMSVEKVEKSEKLLKLSVDFGLKSSVETEDSTEPSAEQGALGEERDIRQIVSGIAKYFPEEQILVGKKCMFVTNLEPRNLMGLVSNGMLFAVGGRDDNPFSILEVSKDTKNGTLAS